MAVVLVVVVVLGLSACATGTDRGSTSPDNGGTGANGGTALDGAALLEQRCTRCHSTARILGASKDRAGWLATIETMVAKGALLTEEEKSALADYLANR
jgi:cytochrome c5